MLACVQTVAILYCRHGHYIPNRNSHICSKVYVSRSQTFIDKCFTIKHMVTRYVILLFFANIALLAGDLDIPSLERQCKDMFFTKRPRNDYDFINTYQADFIVNVNFRDQIKIHADRCVYEYSGIIRFDDGVMIEYYDESCNCVFRIIANKAFFSPRRNVWLLYGYVKLQTFGVDKRVIYTDYVYYMQEEKILFNNSYLKIESDSMNVSGEGIVIKDQMAYCKIFSPQIVYIKSL